ncbi:hypothetical protein DIRU0_C14620 [Diutina rugosa]
MLPTLFRMADVKVSKVPVNPPTPPPVVQKTPVVVEKPVVVHAQPRPSPPPPQPKKVVVKPPKRIGAFRGGFTGFLLGVTVTGAGAYYYLLDEYKKANNVIMADIIALQTSIARLEELQKR